MPDYHIACNTRGQYEASVSKLYTVSNLHYQLCSPFFSVISCSFLIYINLPPPPIPSHFPIPKLVEIHKFPMTYGIYLLKPYLLLHRLLLLNHVELYLNLMSMKKNTNYALIKSTKHRQGSNFKHIYYIRANYKYKAENLLPPFSFMEKEE